MDAATWLADHQGLLVHIVDHAGIPIDDRADVCQNASLHIWRYWESWQEQGRSRNAWAVTIAKHCAIDWHRHEASLRQKAERLAVEPSIAVDVEERALLAVELADLWRHLTSLQRQVTAALVAGYGYPEQAAALGLTPQAIKARQFRLRYVARHGWRKRGGQTKTAGAPLLRR